MKKSTIESLEDIKVGDKLEIIYRNRIISRNTKIRKGYVSEISDKHLSLSSVNPAYSNWLITKITSRNFSLDSILAYYVNGSVNKIKCPEEYYAYFQSQKEKRNKD